jgi:hypothetical protein
MEKYLTGQIADNRKYLEERMLESSTLQFMNVTK